MIKTIKQLTVSERIKITRILNEFKGNLDKLAIIIDDIKKFAINDEDLKPINGKVVIKENGEQMIYWDKLLEKELSIKDIEVQEITLDYLNKYIDKKNDKGEFGIDEYETIKSIKEKING